MDLQELEKVAEIIKGLGDKAVDGLILFVGANMLVEIIGYGVGVFFLVLAHKLLRQLADKLMLNSHATEGMCHLRQLLNAGSDGPLMYSEVARIVEKVKALTKNREI